MTQESIVDFHSEFYLRVDYEFASSLFSGCAYVCARPSHAHDLVLAILSFPR